MPEWGSNPQDSPLPWIPEGAYIKQLRRVSSFRVRKNGAPAQGGGADFFKGSETDSYQGCEAIPAPSPLTCSSRINRSATSTKTVRTAPAIDGPDLPSIHLRRAYSCRSASGTMHDSIQLVDRVDFDQRLASRSTLRANQNRVGPGLKRDQ